MPSRLGITINPPRRTRADSRRIVFVHTPMSTVRVPERQPLWQNFDRRYHMTHPGLHHMRRPMWELPHWMTWLGGVLNACGYTNLGVLDYYSTESPEHGMDRARTIAALEARPAEVYLFSPMTANLHLAYEIAAHAKSLYPHCITIFGGVVATPQREEVAAHASVDYVVYGRGEYALPRLLDALAGHGDLRLLGNVCYSDSAGLIRCSESEYPWMPLEEMPFPKVDLFDRDVGLDIRYLRLVYGLGCPYKCAMCTIQTIGRRPGYFSVKRVMEELDAYRAHYGPHHNVYFGDETFTLSSERTLELCQTLTERGDVMYDCQTRLNRLDDEAVLEALVRSGCRWLEIGIESVNQETQDLFKQRIQLHSLRETLRRLREKGLPVCSFLINAFPNQSTDDMRRSIDITCDLISDGLLHASYLFGLVPYPGSDLFSHPSRYRMKIHHEDFRWYHEDLPPVFDTDLSTSDEAYAVFLYGVSSLADAMSCKPYLCGSGWSTGVQEYGSFWSAAHV
jgi:radical SAM superfamily enzyme YgiQ (UPF0313 family)